MTDSLLPLSNRTLFELAQSETSAARRPLPAHLIASVWNPKTCPVALLPYLAEGLGLEIWKDDWTEAYKREVVASIWKLKRNKTKLKGIKDYLALAGADLISAARPRDKRWWITTMTEAERAAQMAAMPKIRITVEPAPVHGSHAKKFWSGRATLQAWTVGVCWQDSNAADSVAGRATYVDKGVSTPITVNGLDSAVGAATVVQLHQVASPQKAAWGARKVWGHMAFLDSEAAGNVVNIIPSQDPAVTNFAVPPGLMPVEVRPLRVASGGAARPGQRWWGRASWSDGAYLNSDADAYIYDEITLFDPSRLTAGRQPYSFWGYSRWGRPAFEANLRVSVPVARPSFQFGWGQSWGRAFWRRSDITPLWDAVAAVDTAKAKRDYVYLDTKLFESITFSPGLRFGDPSFTRFGDQRKLT